MTQPTMTPEEQAKYLDSLSLDARSGQSPLIDFQGRLVEIAHKQVQSSFAGTDGRTRMNLQLNFKFDQLEVYKSEPVYVWKTADVMFIHENQAWGVFGASMKRILGSSAKLSDLVGHVLRITRTPGHKVRRRNEATNAWEESAIEAFELVSIDGKAVVGSEPSKSIDDVLVELANNQTLRGFETKALQDSTVKTNTSILMKLSSVGAGPMLIELIAQGKLTKDDQGVYHKVEAGS